MTFIEVGAEVLTLPTHCGDGGPVAMNHATRVAGNPPKAAFAVRASWRRSPRALRVVDSLNRRSRRVPLARDDTSAVSCSLR